MSGNHSFFSSNNNITHHQHLQQQQQHLTNDTITTQLPPELDLDLDLLPFPPDMATMLGGDDSDDDVLISKSVFNTIELVLNVFLINGLSLIGSAGNIMSIVILHIHGIASSSTNVVLFSLAVTDLLLVLTMPLRKFSLLIQYFDAGLALTVENYIIRYHFYTLNRVWSLISNSHVALIAVERVIAVCFPFQVGRWVTISRMTCAVLLTHAVWYIALTPLFTMFDLTWIWDPILNETVAFHTVTQFYQDRESVFNSYYSFFINISVGAFLLLFTLVCCVTIMVKIWRTGQKRKFLTGSSTYAPSSNSGGRISKRSDDNSNGIGVAVVSMQASLYSQTQSSNIEPRPAKSPIDIKALKMLMTVCVAFLVLIFPTFFLPLFQGIFPKLRNPYWRRVNFVATSISMFLITVNSSINFIIYVMLSSKFHRTFCSLFACGRRRRKKVRIDTPKFPTRSC